MTRFVLILLLGVAATAPAAALTCTPREFAQYVQDTQSASRRLNLALSYCQAKRTRGLHPAGSQPAVQCDAEMTKAADALRGSKASKNFYAFAMGDCKGELPEK